MNKIAILFSFLIVNSTFACLVLEADGNGDKDHPYIKHFNENGDKKRQIVLKNYTSEDCEFSINKLELIQSKNGAYSYLDARPGINVKRSLNPYMTIVDVDGNDTAGRTLIIGANNKKNYNIIINLPEDKKEGSFHAGYKVKFEGGYSNYLIGEIYYTNSNQIAAPRFNFFKFNEEKNALTYAIKNTGNAYTFLDIQLIYSDPFTGFESNGVRDEEDNLYKFKALFRTYPLPEGRTIVSDYKIDKHLRILKKQFKKQFPDKEFPSLLNVVAIPFYGIDFNTWKNHKNIPLTPKSVMIKTK